MKLYHLSEENLNHKYLQPRVPSNFMTKSGHEDNKTPRISFAKSIGGALTGMSSNIQGKIFYVHEPYDYEGLKVKDTKDLIEHRLVPDAHHSKEVWVLQPVKLRLVSIIQVIGSHDAPLRYSYGNGLSAETYRWTYKKLDSMMHLIKDK